MANSLGPHGLQHARFSCPSPTPGAYSNSCPLSQWCHPTISSCHLFSSHLRSFPASVFSSESVLCIRWPKYWSFSISWKYWSFSISFSISPSNEYSGLFPGLISLQSKRLSRVFSNSSKASILQCSAFFMVQLSHPYMTICCPRDSQFKSINSSSFSLLMV